MYLAQTEEASYDIIFNLDCIHRTFLNQKERGIPALPMPRGTSVRYSGSLRSVSISDRYL